MRGLGIFRLVDCVKAHRKSDAIAMLCSDGYRIYKLSDLYLTGIWPRVALNSHCTPKNLLYMIIVRVVG